MLEHVDEHEAMTAYAHGLQGCSMCTTVHLIGAKNCDVCGSRMHPSWRNSLQETWAWLVTSVILYVPANILPIMHTNYPGQAIESTIIGGVILLWQHGSYPIAFVIFVASVFVPIAKMLVLAWLCISVHIQSGRALTHKTRLYRVTEFVGRWSMVDVFVVAILVALIQLGSLMSILPGSAALAFAGMVTTTMLAAIAFDPRLIWLPDFKGGSH